jgi:hypothetical protein
MLFSADSIKILEPIRIPAALKKGIQASLPMAFN